MRKEDLEFWVNNEMNVILRGKHGCGKSTIVLDTFNSMGLNYLYFSASTLDPFIDLIGAPKERIHEVTGEPYLDLVRPKAFAENNIDAIFFDELNRASKRTKNAVMELIQFKSINGKKFDRLKIIWAAINPDDDETNKYDVEPLDPAMLDRFHVHYDCKYLPDPAYFREKYGEEKANAACRWWRELTKEAKDIISPRRLDYLLDMHSRGGNLRFVAPNGVNVSKLAFELENGSISAALETFQRNGDSNGAKSYINNDNVLNVLEVMLKEQESSRFKSLAEFYIPIIPTEKLFSICSSNKSFANLVFENVEKLELEDKVRELATSGSSKVSNRAKEAINKIDKARYKNNAKLIVGLPDNVDITNTYSRNAFVTNLSRSFYKNSSNKEFLEKALVNLKPIITRMQSATAKESGAHRMVREAIFRLIEHFGIPASDPFFDDFRTGSVIARRHPGIWPDEFEETPF